MIRPAYITIKKLTALLIPLIMLFSCKKTDTKVDELTLAYQMLGDKTWYLDYSQTITATGIRTRTYLGQSTYFINLLKDKSTVDSDGIIGVYSLDNNSEELVLNISGKTKNGTSLEYSYVIESIGAKNLIARYKESDTSTVKQFFSAK
jgi:hypothetical protein